SGAPAPPRDALPRWQGIADRPTREAFWSRSRRSAPDDVTIHDPAMPCARLGAHFDNFRADVGKRPRKDDLMRHTEIRTPPDLQSLGIERLESGAAVEHHRE